MNVLLLTSHSIAEYDDLRMFTRMGIPTFSIGAYTDPHHPTDDKRPPLPEATQYPELAAAVARWRARLTEQLGDPGPRIDWGKAILPDEVLDWADTIIVHHFPEWWIGGQWDRIKGHRVIWRTCGQSDPRLEFAMRDLHSQGMQIVRYSPRERVVFDNLGAFAGEDVMIRFGKDPDDFLPWTGEDAVVANVTQHMAQRGDACGYGFWQAATEGLPVRPAGPGSEIMRGGIGALAYPDMLAYLAASRVYLYTGTRPASYTLGFIEALMTGTPVLSIGKPDFGPLLETDEIVSWADAEGARIYLGMALGATSGGESYRRRAIELFGLDAVSRQWAAFLGLGWNVP